MGPAEAPPAAVEYVVARDGTPILVRRWRVADGQPWATLLLVHGLAEHSGRYEHVGRQLAAAGIEAAALDLRGFGGSGGQRAWIERWSQLHDDVEERLVALRAAAPSRPLILFGHSMGGLVALGYVLDGRARPDLLVLSAPGIRAEVPLVQRAMVASVGRLAPGLRVANGFDPRGLCADEATQVAYVEDPLCVHRTTLHFARAGFAEQRRVSAAIDRLAVPTLVVHGAEDRIVPIDASGILEGRPGVTRRVYPGLRHELHNEAEGPRVIEEVVSWIRERVSRMPHHPVAAQAEGASRAVTQPVG